MDNREGVGEGFGVGDRADAEVVRADGSYESAGVQVDLSGLDPRRFPRFLVERLRVGWALARWVFWGKPLALGAARMLIAAALGIGGTFHVTCVDAQGAVQWRDSAKNAVTNACLDDLLNVYLRNTTATSAWYIGLVDNAGFTQFLGTDTMPSHSGWSENNHYTGNRQAWAPGAASSQAVTNASTLNYSSTAGVGTPDTIKGLFLCSDATASTSGVKLFATAAFSGGTQVVNGGDTLKITYTVSATTS